MKRLALLFLVVKVSLQQVGNLKDGSRRVPVPKRIAYVGDGSAVSDQPGPGKVTDIPNY